MLNVTNISLQFGKRKLFDDVNLSFSKGNCYGLIGANGSGKSTFLKILSKEIESTTGNISTDKGERISVLKQDQFAYDEVPVLMTVIMGHKRLYDVMKAKDEVYAKEDFSDEDGIKASELESEFQELNGWDAETEAAQLLDDLGISKELHEQNMSSLEGGQKIRVLLAQALFGSPDILLLDEPTNQLDLETCIWLEDFLINFDNTAIVVSHDRHFLDKVCTHIADIDFGKIKLFPGNYSFWSESSQLALRQRDDRNKKVADKRKELQTFIARFSANASKSKQATSRKKILDNLNLEDIKPSSRKYPFVGFEFEKDAGNELLRIDHLSHSMDGEVLFKDLNIEINKGDKVAFIGKNDKAKTALFQILTNEIKSDQGSFKWGISTERSYFPKDHNSFFEVDLNIIDWLRQYSKETDETFVRGFLGRMLFTGEESLKQVKVLSGGEKVRCMLSKMMLQQANTLLLDEPTNHLDLESITSLNKGLHSFQGTFLLASHDHEMIQTCCNRIIELTPNGVIDRLNTTLDDYLKDPSIKAQRDKLYASEEAIN